MIARVIPAVAALLMIGGCGHKEEGAGALAKELKPLGDQQKVAYMMQKATPDSVARFICLAALGDIPGVKIDTLSMATLYAYETYKDNDLQTFSQAFDAYSEGLPLSRKMKLRKLAAEQDPMGLGYELGLEYVNKIRLDHKSAAEVEAEIKALRDVCRQNPEDSATFTRFMKGFKVALEMDGSNEIPKDIYNRYSK